MDGFSVVLVRFAVVVDSGNEIMLNAASLQPEAHSRVHCVVAPFPSPREWITIQRPLLVSQISRRKKFGPGILVPVESQVLVERHRVAEMVSQFVAELLVDFGNGIRVRRITDKKIERNFPVRLGEHRASSRKRKSKVAGVVLISGEEGQAR